MGKQTWVTVQAAEGCDGVGPVSGRGPASFLPESPQLPRWTRA